MGYLSGHLHTQKSSHELRNCLIAFKLFNILQQYFMLEYFAENKTDLQHSHKKLTNKGVLPFSCFRF